MEVIARSSVKIAKLYVMEVGVVLSKGMEIQTRSRLVGLSERKSELDEEGTFS